MPGLVFPLTAASCNTAVRQGSKSWLRHAPKGVAMERLLAGLGD